MSMALSFNMYRVLALLLLAAAGEVIQHTYTRIFMYEISLQADPHYSLFLSLQSLFGLASNKHIIIVIVHT